VMGPIVFMIAVKGNAGVTLGRLNNMILSVTLLMHNEL
jgi:hypothetical protein